jgi:hypothetical protein
LTLEEETRPYSKYSNKQLAAPAPERLAAMEVPINSSKALPIEQINDPLDPGGLNTGRASGWDITSSTKNRSTCCPEESE